MRILHVLDHSLPLHSGYSFRTFAILKQQSSFGWEVFSLTSAKQGVSNSLVEKIHGQDFYRTEPLAGWLKKLPVANQIAVIIGLARRLAKLALELKPDVIHAHSPALNGIAALWVGRKLGLPVVYECRGFWEDAAVDHGSTREGSLRYLATRYLESFVFRRADAVTTICDGLRMDIIQRGIAADKVTLIPNAVDIGEFRFGGAADQMLRQQLGLSDKTVLGFIGSFYAYEGLPLLLHALPLLLRERPDVRILFVGGGPQSGFLKEEAERLNLSDKVVFTGRVPHDQVQQYYNLIDVLVYPRRSMRLTELVTPLKPLEAMAQGRLLVASDVGGHREQIQDGFNGILFKADSHEDLARKILDLLRHPEGWPIIKAAGRKFVETERNWAGSVSRYAPIYSSLCSADKRNQ